MKMRIGIFVLALLSLHSFALAAQPSAKMPRVGLLRIDSPPRKSVDEFRQGLRELGYQEGQNLALDIRWAESQMERLPELAAELIRLNVDVIVTHGPQGVRAAKAVTSTTPIVMGRMDDADVHGFVASLARPGGNVTGLSFQTWDLSGKWLELLKEAFPKVSNVAVLWDATGTANQLKAMDAVGRFLGVKLQVLEVRSLMDFDRAFEAAATAQAKGRVILASPLLTLNASRLAGLAAKHRLPAIYYNRAFAEAGGLMAYGPNESYPSWGWKRAAVYVDKILKGAKPADLPVDQPMRFEFVINLKTAKQIGLTIPPNVLVRANKVIR